MNNDCVIVFIDALPFDVHENLEIIRHCLRWSRPIQPGFGYSINVKSELFAGLNPDEAGFLNEWTYRPGEGFRWLRLPRFVYSIISISRFSRRASSKALSYLVGEDLRNIPLPYLPSLVRTGTNAYERGYKARSLFKDYAVRKYLYSEHGSDQLAFEALYQDLHRKPDKDICSFLAMAGLDHIMHRDGKGSGAYYEAIHTADEHLMEIWELLLKRGNNPRLCLVSDHGMAPVQRAVQFEIEKCIPGAGKQYGYFIDATMVRIWTCDAVIFKEITEWLLAARLPGCYLTPEDRRLWGISSKAFGDIIFLLDEGVMFAPNFFGDKPCKAMHGYWPSLKSQQGIIASNVMCSDDEFDIPLSTLAANKIFEKFIVRADCSRDIMT